MRDISISKNIELIKDLREKIEKYKDEFSKNEALVRYALIDPFLRALGWDTEDPEQVKPEYTIEAGRPDYALFIEDNSKPKAFIGAKKLGKNEDLQQHITYCVSEGVKFFIATDGNHWEIYDAFKQTKLPEKKVTEWDLIDDNPSVVLIRSLVIANIESFGEVPSKSILENREEKVSQKNAQTKYNIKTPLENSSEDIKGRRKWGFKPQSIMINGESFEVKKSKDILIRTAEWLIEKGKMTKSTVPIESGSKRYLVNITPVHKSDSKFFNFYKLSNGLFLETHASSKSAEKYEKKMMKYYGYPEDSISVEWK
ncbi:MAG: hypothetical protein ACP5NL_07040 [Thermoplasmata archaeon]